MGGVCVFQMQIADNSPPNQLNPLTIPSFQKEIWSRPCAKGVLLSVET